MISRNHVSESQPSSSFRHLSSNESEMESLKKFAAEAKAAMDASRAEQKIRDLDNSKTTISQKIEAIKLEIIAKNESARAATKRQTDRALEYRRRH